MKFYIQFYNNGIGSEKGTYQRALGSDGVFILDGRNTKFNMIRDGTRRAYQLRKIKKFVAFRVMQGDRFDISKAITRYNKIKYPDQFCIDRGYDYGGICIK